MSTLLERMVQRTRAPLSAVQPWSRPRYAPAPSLLEGQGLEEVQILTDSSPVVGPTERPRAGEPAARQQPQTEPARPARDATRPVQARRSTQPEAIEPRATRADPRHPVPSEAADRALGGDDASLTAKPPRERPLDAGDPGADERGIVSPHGARSAPSAASQSAARYDDASLTAKPPRERPLDAGDPGADERPAVPADQLAPQIRRPPAGVPPAPIAALAGVTPAAAGAVEDRRSGESVRPPAGQSADTRPGVTITIGHIEVRAAPPSKPPRAPEPFRPRVSLEHFLATKQDRRR